MLPYPLIFACVTAVWGNANDPVPGVDVDLVYGNRFLFSENLHYLSDNPIAYQGNMVIGNAGLSTGNLIPVPNEGWLIWQIVILSGESSLWSINWVGHPAYNYPGWEFLQDSPYTVYNFASYHRYGFETGAPFTNYFIVNPAGLGYFEKAETHDPPGNFFAWSVVEDSSSPVPEPTPSLLLLSAILGMLSSRTPLH